MTTILKNFKKRDNHFFLTRRSEKTLYSISSDALSIHLLSKKTDHIDSLLITVIFLL